MTFDEEDLSKDEDPVMVTSNMVGRRKSARPSTTKTIDDGVFKRTRNHSRACEDEVFRNTCSVVTESKTNNLANELEVSVNMDEASGQGVKIVELVKKKDVQQKAFEELKLMIQLLVNTTLDKGKRRVSPSLDGRRGKSRQKSLVAVRDNV